MTRATALMRHALALQSNRRLCPLKSLHLRKVLSKSLCKTLHKRLRKKLRKRERKHLR